MYQYYLRKAYYFLRFRCESLLTGRSPLIVYQMGNVGSRTVVDSLESLKLGLPIYHVHQLTDDGLDYLKRKNHSRNRAHMSKNYWASYYFSEQIRKNQQTEPWQVISMVRDPIARNISAFFQAIDIWHPIFAAGLRSGHENEVFDNIVGIFLANYPHEKPLTWFQNDMLPVFGLDVFETDFDTSNGYSIYEHEKIRLLLIRLEDLNDCASDAIADYLHIPKFSLRRVNSTSSKYSGSLYKDFVDQISLPSSYIEQMYNSQYMRHFYTQEEINMFTRKWSTTVQRM